jgi:hypothetical protein
MSRILKVIWRIPIAKMTTQQANTNQRDEASIQSATPDTSALTAQAEKLEASAGRYNTANVGLLYAAGLVAVLIAVVAFRSGRVNNQLRDVQNELLRTKDNQLAHDLKEKDVHIADADRKAAEANAKAAEANEGLAKSNEKIASLTAEAERARADTAEAQKEIARLTAEAEKAGQGIAIAQADAARANEKVAKANERAEQESLKRVELEKSLARRSIPRIQRGNWTNVDELRPFAGIQVMIEFLPEAEASRAAQNLSAICAFAGWTVVSVLPNPKLAEPIWDGVVVESYQPRHPRLPNGQLDIAGLTRQMRDEEGPREAASALVKFLESNNWKAMRRPTFADETPPLNTIRIRVGLKPEPAFLTPSQEEAITKGMSPEEVEDFFMRMGLSSVTNRPFPQQRADRRHLTAEQRNLILKPLAELKDLVQNPVIVPLEFRCPAENDEACAYADEIAELLRNDGWPIKGGVVIRDREFPRRLTGLVIREGNSSHPADWYLFEAFKDAGLEVKHEYARDSTRYDPLQILVGW